VQEGRDNTLRASTIGLDHYRRGAYLFDLENALSENLFDYRDFLFDDTAYSS
jgi:hypothetical protein